MVKYAWATDCHLDHIPSEQAFIDFANSLIERDPPGIFITGDISNAQHLVYHLSALEKLVQRPIFYVLGNHDFYNGDIESVRKSMKQVSNMSQFLKYVPLKSYTMLTPSTALVGHDGWYDALNGDAKNSQFMMSDWCMIKDFLPHSGGHQFMYRMNAVKDKDALITHVRKLAHEAVLHVHNGIKDAVRYHKNVIVLTHYPPFAESHVYRGQVGDKDAQPWYTSKMMGDMLLDAAKAFPHVNFTVLAGHTHGHYEGKHADNLRVIVGGAEYRSPKLSGLIEVP